MSTSPRSRRLPIPASYDAQGIRRYGFHGLSCAFLMQKLQRLAGSAAAAGNVILAHLGGGSSLAAINNGHSIDTTMARVVVRVIPTDEELMIARAAHTLLGRP